MTRRDVILSFFQLSLQRILKIICYSVKILSIHWRTRSKYLRTQNFYFCQLNICTVMMIDFKLFNCVFVRCVINKRYYECILSENRISVGTMYFLKFVHNIRVHCICVFSVKKSVSSCIKNATENNGCLISGNVQYKNRIM